MSRTDMQDGAFMERARDDLQALGFTVVPSVVAPAVLKPLLEAANALVSTQSEAERSAHRSLGTLLSTSDEPRFAAFWRR